MLLKFFGLGIFEVGGMVLVDIGLLVVIGSLMICMGLGGVDLICGGVDC